MRKILLLAAAAAVLSTSSAMGADKPKYGAFGLETGLIDKAVKPGDDFYTYVNGGWEKANAIPADRSNWGNVGILREQSLARVRGIIEGNVQNAPTADARKIGDYYASFMDEAAIEARGLAPVTGDLAAIAAIKTPAELGAAMGRLERTRPIGASGVFPVGIGVVQDFRRPEQHTVYVSQGGLGLPDRDYYLVDEPKFVAARTAYKGYLATLFRLAGLDQPDARAERVFALETEIARAHWRRVDMRDLDKIWNVMSPAQLAAAAPGFDWAGYLKATGFAGRSELVVTAPSSLAGFAKLSSTTPLETWRDYMRAQVLNSAAPLLPKAFVEANFAMYGTTLSGTPQLRERWKRGVDATNLALGHAVGRQYAEQYFGPEAKAKIQDMVAQIKVAFARRIDRLDWMAPETKQRAKLKLNNLRVEVGYPDKWKDYSKLTVVRGDAYGNAQRAGAFEWDRDLAKLGQAVDRSEWSLTTTPQTVNAFNYGSLVKLAFPAGYLEPPMFDPAADPAVNYGAIGTTIGHEISHSFDDQGAKRDETGRLAAWWSEKDVEAFKASTAALAQQYDAYEALPGLKVQGRLTLGENVADLGGVAAALDAYHASLGGKPAPVIDGLTGDQRFFLSYAQKGRSLWREPILRQIVTTDPHAPDRFRTYTVRNLDAWYAAFDVKPGDKLYLPPEQRVRIW
jgi:putative endopeptidase